MRSSRCLSVAEFVSANPLRALWFVNVDRLAIRILKRAFFEKLLVNHWILGRERFLIAAGHARVLKFPSTRRQGRAVAAEEKIEGYLLRVRTDCVKLQIAESFRGGFDGALNIKRIAQVVR